MQAISQFIHAVTGKERLTDCSEDELRQMVRLYPFFGPAQLLLAKKEREENNGEMSTFSAKASLFVPNPIWFAELMNEREWKEELLPVSHDTVIETPATEEKVIEQVSTPAEEAVPQTTTLEEPATTEEVIEQAQVDIRTETETVLVPDERENEEKIETDTAAAVIAEKVPVYDEDGYEEIEEDLTEGSDSTINTAADEPLRPMPSFKIEPIDPAKMELSFEPYHTVDYFASQGIRFKEEEKPKDRLGLQLKSFTEWLKTLKKAPATEIPATASRQEEKKVEKMAEVSVTDPEVVTEAMAEVWEKQGNTVKALELYRKLSLLDPTKSAYFAAKIEHLKQL